MDKIVKITLLCFIFNSSIKAQEWQSISHQSYDCVCPFVSNPWFYAKYFHINPYDNSLWTSYSNQLKRISNEGVYKKFDDVNIPEFNWLNPFGDIDFTQNSVFALKAGLGMFRYENNEWALIYQDQYGLQASTDGDTLWQTYTNDNFSTWYNNTNYQGDYSNFERTEHKNGRFWGSTDYMYIIKQYKNNTPIPYFPDSCILLDQTNYDFKFSKNTDSIYVAGKLGLSIAHEDLFIDSIAMASSTNMPSSSIVEFEFDQQDNIWALFGDYPISSNTFTPNSIGYYEQATRTWTKNYDATNSPIDFTKMFTIEVDTAGNLWVAQENFLHVLKINNYPTWLNTMEVEKNNFSLYPNPGSELLNIEFENMLNAHSEIVVIDVNGKELIQQKVINKTSLELNTKNLENGIYFIQIKENNQISSTQKWIKL